MVYNEVKHILPRFAFEGDYYDAVEMTSGNINNTYRLEYRVNGESVFYTLQHINRYVFKNPQMVMENIERVTEHLRASYIAEDIDPTRHVLHLIGFLRFFISGAFTTGVGAGIGAGTGAGAGSGAATLLIGVASAGAALTGADPSCVGTGSFPEEGKE